MCSFLIDDGFIINRVFYFNKQYGCRRSKKCAERNWAHQQ